MADVPQRWRSVLAARAVAAEQGYGSLRLRECHTAWAEWMTRGSQVSLEWVGRFTVNSVEAILATLAVEYDILRSLKPADMTAAARSLCFPGTQKAQLKEVKDWLVTSSDQNILWLHGAAGLGKSTIATTIADHFGGLRRQGAFLLFDRNTPFENAPERVVSTLAFQLAQNNAAIRSTVFVAIRDRPGLVSDLVEAQFKSLLLDPLFIAAEHIEGPIIIVLDALDECGDVSSRRKLLELLSNDFSMLPPQFRILITSRPEHDIKCALASRSHIHTIDLSTASDADMQIYMRHGMRRIYENRRIMDELPEGWGDAEIERLVGYAAGLFIWAATSINLLSNADDPIQWLANLLRRESPTFTLHDLYETALLSVREWVPGEATDVYRRILGLIIISQVPLTDETIVNLLGFQDGGRACRTALRRLGSVIQWSEGQSARTLHKSFPDYLTDSEHCSSKPWLIDVPEHQHSLTVSCLRAMNQHLHFNMCNLSTSHISNADIADLSERVERAVPQSLSYPCLFWGHHIRQSLSGDSALPSLILNFFEQKFLYWLEVLSLMGEVRLVSDTMIAVKDYIKNPGSAVDAFAQDGLAFSRVFGQAMSFSTPHIYLSCIPFAPRASVIKQQYTPLMKKILGIRSGMDDIWPVLQQVLEGHTGRVYSVAFSPDGRRVASGSGDRSVRVWDAETGALITGPFEGHTAHVISIAFSPDGQRIASGSGDKTVCVWNAETGALVAGPFEGHTDWVISVIFSSDGRRIASGSSDGSIYIWDTRTRSLLSRSFNGHIGNVNAGAFSPDVRRIALGSATSVQVFDTETGALVAGPSQGHTGYVRSVAFSPDGQRIASGSDDGSVRVWDAQTGPLIAGPFKGHTSTVTSVVFSPDGRCIASGSWDHSIRVWTAETGILAAGPFKGHTSWVTSVAFSPNGQYIASGSDDLSVRVWDALTGALIAGPFEEHAEFVKSVAFSADGHRLMSASDHTIHVGNFAQMIASPEPRGATSSFPGQASPHDDADAGFASDSRLEHGWMRNRNGDLLFWVPPEHRRTLCSPHAITVIPRSTRLDPAHFVHGGDWAQCFMQQR
ncbi:hypothetical protein HWV62_32908 [Athelia sp. TMB]|nr:hypothetical protein HWV62_32908 [Athelia sp. TMB]